MPIVTIDNTVIKGRIHHLDNKYLALKGNDGWYIVLERFNMIFILAYGHRATNLFHKLFTSGLNPSIYGTIVPSG